MWNEKIQGRGAACPHGGAGSLHFLFIIQYFTKKNGKVQGLCEKKQPIF
jgi:hypothetical protein